MTQIERIKAEIERLLNEARVNKNRPECEHDVWYQQECACLKLLSFIESLEQEPKFKIGDMVISTKNPHLTYKVLEVGLLNELGKLDYKVEILTDGKSTNNIHLISCDKMDEWGKLVSSPKIKGWVARDEDGTLHFFSSECGDGEPIFDKDSGTWGIATMEMLEIVHPSGAFGVLSFADEPIEVELTIHRV